MNRQRLPLPARDGLESWSPDIGEPTGNQRVTDIAAQLPKLNVVGSNPIGHSISLRACTPQRVAGPREPTAHGTLISRMGNGNECITYQQAPRLADELSECPRAQRRAPNHG